MYYQAVLARWIAGNRNLCAIYPLNIPTPLPPNLLLSTQLQGFATEIVGRGKLFTKLLMWLHLTLQSLQEVFKKTASPQRFARTSHIQTTCKTCREVTLPTMQVPKPIDTSCASRPQPALHQALHAVTLPEEDAGRADREADDEQAHRLWPPRDQPRQRREAHKRPAQLAAPRKHCKSTS